MSNLIILSEDEKLKDADSSILFQVPIGFLDPNHPDISIEAKKQILRDRYHKQLIQDGLETGNFTMNQDGSVNFKTNLPPHSFSGFIFEALAVRIFNDNLSTIGRRAFEWCTKRERTKNDYLEQFKAIGTGFLTTQQIHPNLYSYQHRFDIQFIRPNPRDGEYESATVLGTSRDAGVQIKAITGNEKSEIIEPLLSGKYSHVLTFLRHHSGIHSAEVCHNIISQMYRNNEIDLSQKNKLEDSIKSPEMLGEDQRKVDEYYNYIHMWYNGKARHDAIIYEGVGLEVKGFKYANGILVPE